MRLEAVASEWGDPVLRLIRSQIGDGAALRQEGVVAKDPGARYLSGKRHPGWRKIKFVKRQEFVVGGWTEGRQTRSHFGALIVGYYAPDDPEHLVYAGHVGSGFNSAELSAIGEHLQEIERDDPPFADVPPTNETTHWVYPSLVVDVKFTQWTADDVLRNPVYMGVRTDREAEEVRREDTRAASRPAQGVRRQETGGKPRRLQDKTMP